MPMGIWSSPAAAGRLERGLNKTNRLEVKDNLQSETERYGVGAFYPRQAHSLIKDLLKILYGAEL